MDCARDLGQPREYYRPCLAVDEQSETDAKLSRLRQAFITLEARDPESPSAGCCKERLKIVIESCADNKREQMKGTGCVLVTNENYHGESVSRIQKAVAKLDLKSEVEIKRALFKTHDHNIAQSISNTQRT